MTNLLTLDPKLANYEWTMFPGGDLEAPQLHALCPECRKTRRHAASLARKTLCFRCYRIGLARERGIAAAAALHTASEARFQVTLPFEPVDRVRLLQLRAECQQARRETRRRAGQFASRRRQAQIAARHALDRVGTSFREPASGTWLPYAVGR
jgi:hypothetical protein